MRLKKFNYNNKQKILLTFILGGTILSLWAIKFLKSYALYQEEKEYNVIRGIVPDWDYDIKVAINVDGEDKKEVPDSNYKDEENNYYKVGVSCSNDVKGEWDYNAWNLKIDNVVKGTKCHLTFLSEMSEQERDNIIKQGVQIRRNTYRGKDITEYKKLPEDDPMNLYNQIKSGKFNDIYVGDYIVSDRTDAFDNKIVWLIADLDNYWNQGDTPLTTHHATIIPANKLQDGQMNTTNIATGGYKSSAMYKMLESTILPTYITPDFGDHVIKYRNLISNTVDNSRITQYGANGGASSYWEWTDRYLDLMSEVNVYGTIVWSSSGYDIGADNRQYAIFQLRPELISQDLEGNRYFYWLKSVVNSSNFAYVNNYGTANFTTASNSYGVRPRFLID